MIALLEKQLLDKSSKMLKQQLRLFATNSDPPTKMDQQGDKKECDESKLRNEDEKSKQKEIGGPAGPEPTRYGDWERKGRVSDFWFQLYSRFVNDLK